MSGFRWLVDQYLQLPKWERIANVVLLSLILGSTLVISLWPEATMTEKEKSELDKKEAALLVKEKAAIKKDSYGRENYRNYALAHETANGHVFISDITKATVADLTHAGLSTKVAKGMYNYIQKGGKIRNEKDVRKIYGITDEMAVLFLKNVNLGKSQDTLTKLTGKNMFGPREKTLVNINTADSATMVFIDGISPKMIPYIIKFRNAVVAFHSVEQLNEVFKSPMKNFEHIKGQITVEGFKPFIKINAATADELKKHKYFKKDNLAATLVAYRDKHGKFTKPEDLKKCAVVTDEILAKIKPYLIFE
ncbi:MAG TPA: helix-hairpin-helix domain-containing protein [Flavobacteriales bacterium]|nr:helix-hairpin-helix domain-containing protein [Flavobacteriales bacterium]